MFSGLKSSLLGLCRVLRVKEASLQFIDRSFLFCMHARTSEFPSALLDFLFFIT